MSQPFPLTTLLPVAYSNHWTPETGSELNGQAVQDRRPRHRHVSKPSTARPEPESPDQERAYEDEFFANWLVPSHDEKGHSERENVRFSPGTMRSMQILVESGKTPYQTKSDLIRHAVHIHLEALERLQTRTGRHFLVGLKISQQVAQDEAYRQELEKLFTGLEQNIRYHLQRGETGEATRQAGMLWQEFLRVADSPWKRQAQRKFLYQHGYLLGWTHNGTESLISEPMAEKTGEVIAAEVVDPGEEDS